MSPRERQQQAEDRANAAILALVQPPEACPSCYAKAGQHFPAGATTRICPRCCEEMYARSEALKQHQDVCENWAGSTPAHREETQCAKEHLSMPWHCIDIPINATTGIFAPTVAISYGPTATICIAGGNAPVAIGQRSINHPPQE
jgi:hypothetical protein